MPRVRRSSPARLGASVGVVVTLSLTATACLGGDDPRDPAAFCTRLRAVQPALTDPSDSAALVALYQDLDDEAPLQIQDDWHHVTLLLAELSKLDPADESQRQKVLTDVLTSQASINAIATWAEQTCTVTLGPIPTTVPIGGTGDSLITDSTDAPDASDASDDAST